MNAAQAAADKLGVKLVTYTANNDPTQELANVQDAITKGVDGILIYAVSLSSEKAAIAQAKRAGVPIFFQYGYDPALLKDAAGFMEINLFTFGEPVGEAIGKKVTDGEVAIITGKLGRGDAEAFAQSFKNGLKDVGLEGQGRRRTRRATGIARRRSMRHRRSSPPTRTSRRSTPPTTTWRWACSIAIGRAGKTGKILLGSCNGAPYGIDLIKQGKMTLTNGNPPSIASVQSLRLLLDVIDKKIEPGQFYPAPTGLTDSSNMDKAIPWDAKAEDVAAWLAAPLPQPTAGPTPPTK